MKRIFNCCIVFCIFLFVSCITQDGRVRAGRLSPGSPLHEAAKKGDLEAVRNFLSAHPEGMDARNATGKTAVALACETCNAQITLELLEAGADINLADNEGFTPLALACAAPCEDNEMLSNLIKAGADPNAISHDGSTPLSLAVEAGHQAYAVSLLEAGAEADAKNKWGDGVIFSAVQKQYSAVVKLLLEKGADPNCAAKRNPKWTLLFPAVTASDIEITRLLIKAGAKTKIADAYGMTPLMYARSANVAKALVDAGAGADVNAVDEYGMHAMEHAAAHADIDTLGVLVRAGANLRYTEARVAGLEVVAVHIPSRIEVARYFTKQVAAYVPALEEYMGVSVFAGMGVYPDPKPRRIAIYFKEGTGSAYWTSEGIYLFTRHIVNPGLKERYIGVVYHELGHYYFRGRGDIAWFIEGANSILPIAAAEEGLLNRDKVPVWGVKAIWGFTDGSTVWDKPCIEDFRRENFNYFYSKSLKIQYLILKELGSKKYRAFIKDVFDSVFAGYAYSEDRNGLIIELLGKQKKIDWESYLSGWIFPGKYAKHKPQDFFDKNKNGIADIEEKP